MASFLRLLSEIRWRAPLLPKRFTNLHYESIPESLKIEEETLPDFLAIRYYPVRIGEVLASRYQVLGKLGYGTTSTVWLATDLNRRRYVAVKVFVRSASLGDRFDHEMKMYGRVSGGSRNHLGRDAVRALLDSFRISGPDGEHQCLVHPPLWESIHTFLARNPVGRLPPPVLAVVLYRTFRALDYLHNECRIIHTDIKSDNIMFGFEDDSALVEFEQAELSRPSPRKEVSDGRFVYLSRQFPKPKRIGPPVLCDFGAAVAGDRDHCEDVQPDQYRCPEVILKVPWDYKIDVWNVGCMVWDIFEGGNLFRGIDPEHDAYRGRAHLAEIISLLGPPSPSFVARGKLKSKFFMETGELQPGVPPLAPNPLAQRETNLGGKDKDMFLRLMNNMIQWAPEDRCAPMELLEDAWVRRHLFG